MKKLIPMALALIATGCTINRPYVKEDASVKMTPDGIGETNYTRIVKGTSTSIWPAKQDVEAQKITAGKTISVGTGKVGQENTGGTNGVLVIQSLERIVERLTPP